jgi:hypothetical protein
MHTGGGLRGCSPPPKLPQNQTLKNTDFVDIISKVLHDLPFSRNKLMKLADDQYIRLLKNKLIKFKKKTRRQGTVIELWNM